MFKQSYGIEAQTKPMAKSMERCKPDYEAMIKRCEQQKEICQQFLQASASLEALDITIRDEFLKVVGQVYIHAAQQVASIDRLIKMQEQED